jgi:hypothetical protein
MAISAETARRFTDYVEHADRTDASFGHDDALLDFVAWAVVHDPSALQDRFAFYGIMRERGVDVSKMHAVHTVLAAARPLVAAYERERSLV